MYRSVLVSIVLFAVACKGGANAASAAKSNSVASSTPVAAQTSDTGAAVAGPISTTEIPSTGSAANSAGGASAPAGPSAGPAVSSGAISGTPNPNRVPNEMGRIMVLEYHLIGDRNSAYSRERVQFRKDLELLYDRGYRPVKHPRQSSIHSAAGVRRHTSVRPRRRDTRAERPLHGPRSHSA